MKTKLPLSLLAGTAVALVATSAMAGELTFTGIAAAKTDAEKREAVASPSVTIDGNTHEIAYHVLARSGDEIGNNTFGLLVDENGEPVKNEDGSTHISVDADFSSLLTVGDKLFNITHFESRPGAMYLSELKQDDAGNLTPVSTEAIDFSSFGGLWVPCAGSFTPWETHLGSEEYPPDARAVEEATSMDDIDDYYKPMIRYVGLDPASASIEEFKKGFDPYKYGYPTEITVKEDGSYTVDKHYAMGRVAVELAKVMPDEKTVYISDDGTNVGLFMFVADEAGKLDAGTLYAAKWNQTSGEGAGKADLSWVDLGHSDTAAVAKALADGVTFSDLFEVADIADDGSCAEGFSPSNAEGRAECLKVKDGMEEIASRLETRRYASMKGATTEFRKEEGIALDPATKTLYVAMSEIGNGMEDAAKGGKPTDKYEKGSSNDIRLTANGCGAVYSLPLGSDDKIGSDWVASEMNGLVAGTPHKYAEGDEFAGNTCDMDGLANPDNLTFMDGFGTLIIGEDTGSGHQNDVIWAYKLSDGSLTRIFSTPYGSETTSPYFYPNVGGHGYIMAVVQHPYGESDEDKLADPADARAYVGYIGPFPALTN
ncbi:PhoX family protein [Afifella pfennigii]|uniref:PhoX family protein n=1 Tax=Afifella pfennigii TaxID=209897 RepID=UPI00047B2096|nr:alkaline phosphatase PhoX [Afifella pfennigii]